ncbi:serine/threonine protein kinase [Catenulispora sp. GP43]|uniref:serine/threonine-protein kinase n=1 Tax=Catenulispora sp. GP43 TaxID=3156263 RepID=UPI003517A5C2
MTGEGRLVAGRYRLISELGAGGYGRVWKARDESLRIDVAVKAIELSQVGSDKERAERIARAMREARNAAQLRAHPHIVSVHDVVVDDGTPWIVMELVNGHSLQEELDANGRLPLERVRQIAQEVLKALSAAHTAGNVHRAVKPSNVLPADDGGILLADFGTAVHGDDSPAGDLFSHC